MITLAIAILLCLVAFSDQAEREIQRQGWARLDQAVLSAARGLCRLAEEMEGAGRAMHAFQRAMAPVVRSFLGSAGR